MIKNQYYKHYSILTLYILNPSFPIMKLLVSKFKHTDKKRQKYLQNRLYNLFRTIRLYILVHQHHAKFQKNPEGGL